MQTRSTLALRPPKSIRNLRLRQTGPTPQIDSFVLEKFRRRLLEATSQTPISNRPAQTMLAVRSEACRLPRAYQSVTNILQEPVSRDFTALAVLHSLSIDPSADS